LSSLSSPFKFNPLFGFYERFKIMSRENKLETLHQIELDSDQILFEMSASKDTHSDKLMIRFIQNTTFNIDRLEEMFVKHFQEIADYFNTGQ
jgi:hypothetical protein